MQKSQKYELAEKVRFNTSRHKKARFTIFLKKRGMITKPTDAFFDQLKKLTNPVLARKVLRVIGSICLSEA